MTFFSMRFVPGALLGTLALVSPTGAAAQDEPDETSPAVEYRQSLMQGLAAHRSAVTAIVDDEVDYRSHILAHATALRRTCFPRARVERVLVLWKRSGRTPTSSRKS